MVTIVQLLKTFSLLSILAIGGGNALLPTLQHVVITQNHWFTPEQFRNMFSIGQLAPGPNLLMVIYGIIIKMYFLQSEHSPPHFHAVYGEYNGVFDIQTQQMVEGDLPTRAQRLVKEWGAAHQQDLLEMWNRQEFRQLKGLE